jgi:hypothetical protein
MGIEYWGRDEVICHVYNVFTIQSDLLNNAVHGATN